MDEGPQRVLDGRRRAAVWGRDGGDQVTHHMGGDTRVTLSRHGATPVCALRAVATVYVCGVHICTRRLLALLPCGSYFFPFFCDCHFRERR